jgi:environmental stress-induced protein Ves
VVRVLHFADLVESPWRNGGGLTREVATAPVQEAGEFDWRVSIADVDRSGAFSAFPGVDRVITLLEGDGMVLTVDGVERTLRPHEPFAFAGESDTSCRLPGGPTRDLNVMTRRGRTTGELTVRELAGEPVELTGHAVAVVLDGSLRLQEPEAVPRPLAQLDSVVLGDGGQARLRGRGRVALVRITAS